MKSKSKFRRLYMGRLVIRIIVFITILCLYIFYPNDFIVAKDFNLIKSFTPLTILWLIWITEMTLQLCKVPKYWPLGSQKVFGHRYLPDLKGLDITISKKLMKQMTSDAVSIAIAWILLTAIIDILYFTGCITYQVVILISCAFYVCDIICIVGWCPFKTFFMHNKCCTTCRIFNWDHAMMFLPLICIPGLFTYSLVGLSLFVLIVWEVACAVHPERFHEKTNCALRCINCKDRLCGKKTI